MEQKNLEQGYEKRIPVKVRSSRNGKWLIFNVQGFDQPIILAVNYVREILKSADRKKDQAPVDTEEIGIRRGNG